MIVACPACRSQFQVADEQASRSGVRFRCATCSHIFSLSPPQAAAPPSRSSSETGALPPSRGVSQSYGTENVPAVPSALRPPPAQSVSGTGGIRLPGGFRTPESTTPESSRQVAPYGGISDAVGPSTGDLPGGFRAAHQTGSASILPGAMAPPAPPSPPSPSPPPAPYTDVGAFDALSPAIDFVPPSGSITGQIVIDGDGDSGSAARPPGQPVDPFDVESMFPDDSNLSVDALRRGIEESGLHAATEQALGARHPVGLPGFGPPRAPAPSSFDGPPRAPAPASFDGPPRAPAPAGFDEPARTPAHASVGGPERPSEHILSTGSTVFRVADADGSSEDADAGVDETLRARIDPFVEFNDVFRDIRRAERADAGAAPRNYLDTGLFSAPLDAPPGGTAPSTEADIAAASAHGRSTSASTDSAPARPESGRRSLDLKAGAIRGAAAREDAPRERAMESDMLLAALQDSGLREPSKSTPTAAESQRGRLLALDAAGADENEPLFGELGSYLVAVLVVLLTAIGLLTFVAVKNDGLVDLRAFDRMLAVAFRGEDPLPRAGAVAPVERPWAERISDAPLGLVEEELSLTPLDGGQYVTQGGSRLAVVEGRVNNTADATFRQIEIEVTLTPTSGAPPLRRIVPAGPDIAQPELELLGDHASVDALYASLRGRVEDVELGAGQQMAFTAVFAVDEGLDLDGAALDASVIAAQRSAGICWIELVSDDAPSDFARERPAPGVEPDEPAPSSASPDPAPIDIDG